MAPEAIQGITSGSEHIALGIYPVLLKEPWVNLYIIPVCPSSDFSWYVSTSSSLIALISVN